MNNPGCGIERDGSIAPGGTSEIGIRVVSAIELVCRGSQWTTFVASSWSARTLAEEASGFGCVAQLRHQAKRRNDNSKPILWPIAPRTIWLAGREDASSTASASQSPTLKIMDLNSRRCSTSGYRCAKTQSISEQLRSNAAILTPARLVIDAGKGDPPVR